MSDDASRPPADPHPGVPVDPDAGVTVPELRGRRPLHLRPAAIGLVLLGGVVGTGARLEAGRLLPTTPGEWPAATFAVNLVGSFVLGLLLAALARAGADEGWRRRARLLVGTGFCGALTTYSTFVLDATSAVRAGAPGLAVGYLAASLVGGLVLAALGVAVGDRAGVRR